MFGVTVLWDTQIIYRLQQKWLQYSEMESIVKETADLGAILVFLWRDWKVI
jgi:hypothetical protein